MKVTFKSHSGAERTLESPGGLTLMQLAVTNGVAGIDAICGGACSCGTCHVLVAPEWANRLPRPGPLEAGMLNVIEGRQSNSRLACQIEISEALDGLEVSTPATQDS